MVNKKSPDEVGCITLHPGFQNVCLDQLVLETASTVLDSTMENMLLKVPLMSMF